MGAKSADENNQRCFILRPHINASQLIHSCDLVFLPSFLTDRSHSYPWHMVARLFWVLLLFDPRGLLLACCPSDFLVFPILYGHLHDCGMKTYPCTLVANYWQKAHIVHTPSKVICWAECKALSKSSPCHSRQCSYYVWTSQILRALL